MNNTSSINKKSKKVEGKICSNCSYYRADIEDLKGCCYCKYYDTYVPQNFTCTRFKYKIY